jgi:hypothetical protein
MHQGDSNGPDLQGETTKELSGRSLETFGRVVFTALPDFGEGK